MDSNQYHAIPIGEQQTAFQSASPMKSIRSFGSGGIVQVVGLVVLVALTAFVSVHVATKQIENRAIVGRVSGLGNAWPAQTDFPQRSAGLSGIPIALDENYKTSVRNIVDEICNYITYTACHYSSPKETDWCKICLALK